jgi:hypothetical protein
VRHGRAATDVLRLLEPRIARQCGAALGLLVILGDGAVAACRQTGGNGPGTTVTSSDVDAADDASFFFFGDGNTACFSSCPSTRPATLNLSCPSVVTSVLGAGCTAGLCLAKDGVLCPQAQVLIEPTQTGVCHLDLTLAGGFQYSTDITFVRTTSESSCPCTSIGPTQELFDVDNPSTTCVGAGLDAGASDAVAEAAADAPNEADADAEAE